MAFLLKKKNIAKKIQNHFDNVLKTKIIFSWKTFKFIKRKNIKK
jgi:hypothetical protein